MLYSTDELTKILENHQGETHSLGEWFDIFSSPTPPESSPLADFVKQLDFDGFISTDEIYSLYLQWCDTTPLSKISFLKRLPRTIRQFRSDISQGRTNSTRGYMTVKSKK